MADSWLASSPSKDSGIVKKKSPPKRAAWQNLINAWALRPELEESDGTVTVLGRLHIFVRHDAAHPAPVHINDLVEQLQEIELAHAFYEPLYRNDVSQLKVTLFRAVDARRAWAMIKLFYGANNIKDITASGNLSPQHWAGFMSFVPTVTLTVDRAALNFRLSGDTLPLKPWIEHTQLGMPDYMPEGRYYEIQAGDETGLDARIADVSNLAERFAFQVVMA